MSNVWKAVSALAVAGLMAATPALATVTVNFVPQNSFIPTVGNTTVVEVRADFSEAIAGWGLDVDVTNPGVADLIGYTIGPLWDPAPSALDGEALGGFGLGQSNVGPGANILLATLTFEAFGNGVTPISLGANDEDEGFVKGDQTGFDLAAYGAGTIAVPEPASLALVALGGLMLRRRR